MMDGRRADLTRFFELPDSESHDRLLLQVYSGVGPSLVSLDCSRVVRTSVVRGCGVGVLDVQDTPSPGHNRERHHRNRIRHSRFWYFD